MTSLSKVVIQSLQVMVLPLKLAQKDPLILSQPLLNSIIYEAKKSIYKYNDVDIAWSGVLTERARKSP